MISFLRRLFRKKRDIAAFDPNIKYMPIEFTPESQYQLEKSLGLPHVPFVGQQIHPNSFRTED